MKIKKVKKLLSIFTIILLLFITFSGCFEKTESNIKTQDTKQSKPKTDKIALLPNWKDNEYHDYEGTTQKLKTLDQQYSGLVKLFSIGKSVKNRDIWCVKITNEDSHSQKYSCVIDGCIHGSEWEAGELCLYLAEYLLINFGKNNTVSEIVNTSEIYLIPLLNPDGREQNIRWNNNGVDLNRNFDVHFGRLKGNNIRLGKLFGFIKIPMIERPNGVIYLNCGRRAFSEPETAAFRDFMYSLDTESLSFYVNCHTAVHCVGSICGISYEPEFFPADKQIDVINTALDWVDNNTEYEVYRPDSGSIVGAGFAHHWVFKEFDVFSLVYELLSQDYEPGYRDGGPHSSLVFWMKASLPVLLFCLENIENLHDWMVPDVCPVFPDGVPPRVL